MAARTHSTPAPTRRTTLPAPWAALLTMPAATLAAPAHPDAALLAACAEHLDASHASDNDRSPTWESGPAHTRYLLSLDAVSRLRATTIDGVAAKARSTLAEAMPLNGSHQLDGTIGLEWAADLIEDLVRIAGQGDTLLPELKPSAGVNPDVALITAATEFCRAMDRLDAEAEDDSQEQDDICAELNALGGRMGAMRAVTLDGLAARALALGRNDPGIAFDYEAPGTLTRTLLGSLLRDAAALAGAMLLPPPAANVGASNPDAALLAMVSEFDRRKAACDAHEADPETWDDEIMEGMDDFAAAVLTMPPAQTAAGRAFKARAALHDWSYVADEGDRAAETRIGRFLREIASGAA